MSSRAPYLLGLIALAGLSARLWTLTHLDPGAICGNDFPPLYAGGRLAGTPDLYSEPVNQRLMQAAAGCSTEAGLCFMRPPFMAAFVWPFARLPLRDAMLAWGIASLLALVGFLGLWQAPKLLALALICWSLPVAAAFTQGQDTLFLLLWIAVAGALLSRGRDFAGGLALSLCAAKFHLFLLLPLFLLGQRHRRATYGMLAGGAALAAISFLVGGRDWPAEFLRAALDSRINPHPWLMPNLHGMVYGWPGANLWEAALGLLTAAAVWYLVRRTESAPRALAVTLAGSLLVSHHAYLPDAALLLPAALTIGLQPGPRTPRLLAILTMLPLVYFLTAFPAFTWVPPAVTLALLLAMAAEAWRVRDMEVEGVRGQSEPRPLGSGHSRAVRTPLPNGRISA